jgi:hypothetical protein
MQVTTKSSNIIKGTEKEIAGSTTTLRFEGE